MTGKPRIAGAVGVAIVLAVLSVRPPVLLAQSPVRYQGRFLADALRELQSQGLRIVFSSATVTPELRVKTEPRATIPRQVLDELLAPHRLQARDGPGGVLLIVRADPGGQGSRERVSPATSTIEDRVAHALTHSEHITVNRPWPYRHDPGVASEISMERAELASSEGLVDDPIRAVHALPRVTVADDFYSDFSVRGSPSRHVGVVVDGVSTPWLQHTASGRGTTGSLSMLTSQVVDEATLRVGAYPRRFGDHLGAELEMTIREGSRERFQLRAAAGGTNATIVAEGPLGRWEDRSRGSWLAAARQSYLQWPAVQTESRTPFGFADGLAKLVSDVVPGQKVGFSLLAGLSNVDGEENPELRALADGLNRTTLANVFWRSTIGASTVVTQRAYLVKRRFSNQWSSGSDASRGSGDELVYRADVARRFSAGLLEAGAQAGRTTFMTAADAVAEHRSPAVLEGTSSQRSGYAHVAWSATRALTLSPGIRVTDSSLVPAPIVSRWILGEYALGSRWAFSASAGVSRQLPELHQIAADQGDPSGAQLPLRPERATHVDVAVEQRLWASGRWQVTFFNRDEADIVREPDRYPRLSAGSIIDPPEPGGYTNSLSGWSRGIELVVSRRAGRRLTGWIAYSYGKASYDDADRHERYAADFDQRQTLNAFGQYQVTNRTQLAATFRAATGLPIPAYLDRRSDRLVLSDRRNQVRLPAYARLDLRARRGFEALGRHMTAFVEVVNVLNRANVGVARGPVRSSTGAAVGFTEPLMPRRVSAGIVVQF